MITQIATVVVNGRDVQIYDDGSWARAGDEDKRPTDANLPLAKLHETLLLRAKALKESGDEWMEDMGDHYEGIANELAEAMSSSIAVVKEASRG